MHMTKEVNGALICGQGMGWMGRPYVTVARPKFKNRRLKPKVVVMGPLLRKVRRAFRLPGPGCGR